MTIFMFHGGCSGCTQQEINGTDFCYDCRYFDAQWKKPDLNNRPKNETERERDRIKRRRWEFLENKSKKGGVSS